MTSFSLHFHNNFLIKLKSPINTFKVSNLDLPLLTFKSKFNYNLDVTKLVLNELYLLLVK